MAILEGAELARLLAVAGSYRMLFEFLAYTGLRIGEALGLCWADVDFDARWSASTASFLVGASIGH